MTTIEKINAVKQARASLDACAQVQTNDHLRRAFSSAATLLGCGVAVAVGTRNEAKACEALARAVGPAVLALGAVVKCHPEAAEAIGDLPMNLAGIIEA